MNMLNLVLHLFAQLFVERAERFVHQNEFWVKYERACHCHTLLLSAGKLCRSPPTELRDHIERTLHPFLNFGWPILRTFNGKARFSATVICGKRAYFWNTMPMLRLCGGTLLIGTPSKNILTVGCRFKAGQHH